MTLVWYFGLKLTSEQNLDTRVQSVTQQCALVNKLRATACMSNQMYRTFYLRLYFFPSKWVGPLPDCLHHSSFIPLNMWPNLLWAPDLAQTVIKMKPMDLIFSLNKTVNYLKSRKARPPFALLPKCWSSRWICSSFMTGVRGLFIFNYIMLGKHLPLIWALMVTTSLVSHRWMFMFVLLEFLSQVISPFAAHAAGLYIQWSHCPPPLSVTEWLHVTRSM